MPLLDWPVAQPANLLQMRALRNAPPSDATRTGKVGRFLQGEEPRPVVSSVIAVLLSN